MLLGMAESRVCCCQLYTMSTFSHLPVALDTYGSSRFKCGKVWLKAECAVFNSLQDFHRGYKLLWIPTCDLVMSCHVKSGPVV